MKIQITLIVAAFALTLCPTLSSAADIVVHKHVIHKRAFTPVPKKIKPLCIPIGNSCEDDDVCCGVSLCSSGKCQ